VLFASWFWTFPSSIGPGARQRARPPSVIRWGQTPGRRGSAHEGPQPAPQSKPVTLVSRLVARIAPLVAFGLGSRILAAGPVPHRQYSYYGRSVRTPKSHYGRRPEPRPRRDLATAADPPTRPLAARRQTPIRTQAPPAAANPALTPNEAQKRTPGSRRQRSRHTSLRQSRGLPMRGRARVPPFARAVGARDRATPGSRGVRGADRSPRRCLLRQMEQRGRRLRRDCDDRRAEDRCSRELRSRSRGDLAVCMGHAHAARGR
jgi:hypothetical protein